MLKPFAILATFLVAIPAFPAQAGHIALVQYNADARLGDYDFHLKKLTEFAEQASRSKADILVLPEGSTYGYANADEAWCATGQATCSGKRCRDVATVAEEVPLGRTTSYWQSFARQHAMIVIFNLPEREGPRFYNTSVAVGPTGFLGKYRKRSLYYIDECYATPGRDPFVLNTPVGNFGMLICADANVGGSFDEYKRLGSDAVILPMDWDQDPHGTGGARPARVFFAQQARAHSIDIFASDVSPWDGTGKYRASGGARERVGMPSVAIGQDGVSVHKTAY